MNELLKILNDHGAFDEHSSEIESLYEEDENTNDSKNDRQLIIACDVNDTSKIQKYLNENYKVKDFKITNGYAYDNDCGHTNHVDPTICAILEREE